MALDRAEVAAGARCLKKKFTRSDALKVFHSFEHKLGEVCGERLAKLTRGIAKLEEQVTELRAKSSSLRYQLGRAKQLATAGSLKVMSDILLGIALVAVGFGPRLESTLPAALGGDESGGVGGGGGPRGGSAAAAAAAPASLATPKTRSLTWHVVQTMGQMPASSMVFKLSEEPCQHAASTWGRTPG
eukprot:CAMPEP_0177246738 /NCGR_PEP_ID=MMETSP0367-20130122/51178_1 /TAXON_ID=447022 ORGANISM="Scrippsiella hangoei-like, Strain SHHI-4" /NCGR_SAMPLE_ID=MMETSP0367 /ASSEMBLY_ACC=CAM_ASM_000362 /LENGTH=186 /DNA_ID=CAMNT_0018698795 /DNA_START=13 /DNA_END=570 /DNA_ORIENTATION=+